MFGRGQVLLVLNGCADVDKGCGGLRDVPLHLALVEAVVEVFDRRDELLSAVLLYDSLGVEDVPLLADFQRLVGNS